MDSTGHRLMHNYTKTLIVTGILMLFQVISGTTAATHTKVTNTAKKNWQLVWQEDLQDTRPSSYP